MGGHDDGRPGVDGHGDGLVSGEAWRKVTRLLVAWVVLFALVYRFSWALGIGLAVVLLATAVALAIATSEAQP